MRRIVLLILALAPAAALASLPLQATLEELATESDHILVGRVIGVDMIDKAGVQINDPDGRTGPGSDTQIRLIIQVDEVIASNAQNVPTRLWVPLDPFMHYSLGQIKAAHAEVSPPLLVFLKGARFQPIKPGVFLRPLPDKEAALKLRRKSR
jgi:hypothetical protein